MSYAPVLAAAFVLWPLMGLLGGQGYSPLLALAALPALALARPKWPPALYAVLALVFVAWAAASELWSPASNEFISGSLSEGNFAVKASSLRIVLTALFGTLAVAGAMRIAEGQAQVSARVMLGAFAVQGLILAVSPIFLDQVLTAVYGDDPMERVNGIQNLGRNANAFALALPVLAAYLGTRPGLLWKGIAGLLVIVSLLLFAKVDSQAAMFGVVFMLAAMGLVFLMRRQGFRVLFGGLAAYVAFAPLLIGAGIKFLKTNEIALPGSFQSRAWSWEVVINKIVEKPLMGHGITASKTWRETYADHPDWLATLPDFWASYPVVPGHPHNMALQIWGETGMIGAAMVALAIMFLGFRLPKPETMRADVRYAVAGLAGAAASLFSFAYSVWNEAFWATLILAALAVILLSKRERASL